MGVLSEPYRIGKYLVVDHLEYRLWFNYDLIHEGKTFESCNEAAQKHLDLSLKSDI
jgi:hypothetical protein